MYHRDNEADFNTWHDAVKILENIPVEGKINFVKGVLAPDNQRTMTYSKWIQNPLGGDDGIYRYGEHSDPEGTPLTRDEAKALGWFPPEPEPEED